MKCLSKFGIILTLVLSFLLLALLAELLYLLWRRRQQFRHKISRIKPTTTTTTPTIVPNSHSQIFKLEGIYELPSRVLFTIKEEEKEGIEIDEITSVLAENKKSIVGDNYEHLGDSSEVIIMVSDSDFGVEPPFLTPCTSPPFFTPAASPTREHS
ncbi:uncharacterized protein LOC130814150 [Amaranthus tricolor]|uniref:uncharacterized protein LOC130814150 n=1 Tax=Amaranthus tricolor TaxID=29722 RepID=UPI002589ADC7|nr:uncharacterized protein LOC130814150 [Amaranthus tricolor]